MAFVEDQIILINRFVSYLALTDMVFLRFTCIRQELKVSQNVLACAWIWPILKKETGFNEQNKILYA